LVSWRVKPEADLSGFELLDDPISENSFNRVAHKLNPKEGGSEVMTVNYYLGDCAKLLAITWSTQE
jgi:hypothetical protein